MRSYPAAASMLAALLVLTACQDRGNQKLVDANNLIELGKFPEAEKLISEVIAQYPDHAKAYNNLGFLYVSSHKFDKARPAYLKALELYQKDDAGNIEELANTYDNLGFLDDLQGNNAAAIASYQKAAETDPTQMRPLHNQATLYKKMRQYDKALEFFDKALQIDPYSYQTRVFKALTLLDLGRYEDAVKLYSELLAEDPFKVYLQTQLAWAYMKSGKLDLAAQVLANCLAMNPSSAETQSHIVLLLLKRGKKDDAPRLAAELAALLTPTDKGKAEIRLTATIARNLGLTYAEAGDPEKARDWLQKAQKLDPTEHEIERALAALQSPAAGTPGTDAAPAATPEPAATPPAPTPSP